MPLEAKFASTCSGCEAPIFVGDMIERDPTTDLYVHAECAEDKPLLKPPAPGAEMCPHCGMDAAWPVHGNCKAPTEGEVREAEQAAEVAAIFAHARGEAVPEPVVPPRGSTMSLADLEPGQAVELEAPAVPGEPDIVAAWVPEGSTEVVTLMARPEPDRDKRGRYRLPLEDGKTIRSWTRVTTMCKKVEDTTLIDAWRERQLALGIGAREDYYAIFASHRDPHGEDRKLYTDTIKLVHEAAGTHTKSRLGTALHRFCEEVDRGRMTLAQVPVKWRDQVALYRETLKANGITIDPAGIETIYMDDRHRVAGMGDRRLRLGDYRLPVIGDLKTGSGVELGATSMATQLGIYQDHTATYDPATKKRGPRVEMDPTIGIIIHLPQDGETCELHQVNLGAGREHYQVALEVRAIQRTKREHVMVPYSPRAALAPFDWIAARLDVLLPLLVERFSGDASGAVGFLTEHWPAGVPMPMPTEPTQDQLDAMDAFLAPLERELEAPFMVGVQR